MVEVAVARRRFTREEYHRMGDVGILKETDRVELIRGGALQGARGVRDDALLLIEDVTLTLAEIFA
jgi:hypothetical protein